MGNSINGLKRQFQKKDVPKRGKYFGDESQQSSQQQQQQRECQSSHKKTKKKLQKQQQFSFNTKKQYSNSRPVSYNGVNQQHQVFNKNINQNIHYYRQRISNVNPDIQLYDQSIVDLFSRSIIESYLSSKQPQPKSKFAWKKIQMSKSLDKSIQQRIFEQYPNLDLINNAVSKDLYYSTEHYQNKNIINQQTEILISERYIYKQDLNKIQKFPFQNMNNTQIQAIRNKDPSYTVFRYNQDEVNRAIYSWRIFLSNNSLNNYHPNQVPIVHIYSVKKSTFNLLQTIKNIGSSKNNEQQYIIYQEYIPHRLPDLRNLSHLEGIYVLQQAILGFMYLYKTFGYFNIQEAMIGFNSKGYLKVWISQIFYLNRSHMKNNNLNSNNYPRNSLINEDQYDQQKMVTSIWMVVQKYSLFHQSIVLECNGFRNCNFRRALQLISKHKCKLIGNRNMVQNLLINFVQRIQVIKKDKKPPQLKFIQEIQRNLQLNNLNQQQINKNQWINKSHFRHQQDNKNFRFTNYKENLKIHQNKITQPNKQANSSCSYSHIKIINPPDNNNINKPIRHKKIFDSTCKQCQYSLYNNISVQQQSQKDDCIAVDRRGQPNIKNSYITIKSK